MSIEVMTQREIDNLFRIDWVADNSFSELKAELETNQENFGLFSPSTRSN